jgi:hypothetical protein
MHANSAHPCSTRAALPVILHLVATLTVIPIACIAATKKTGSAPPQDSSPGWRELFDGRSLSGWKITDFGGHGDVDVAQGELQLGMGAMLTGVHYTNSIPRIDYEISLEAKRVAGSDFFCALSIPYNQTNCTLIVGGWGGGVVGISSLDNYDASENETTKYLAFEKDRWYRIRMRVTADLIEAWIDDQQVVDVNVKDRKVSMRAGEIELSVPLGIATWQTAAAIRNIKLRKLGSEP